MATWDAPKELLNLPDLTVSISVAPALPPDLWYLPGTACCPRGQEHTSPRGNGEPHSNPVEAICPNWTLLSKTDLPSCTWE